MMGRVSSLFTLRNATFLLALFMFGWLLNYFNTGAGGARNLAALMVPVAIALHILYFYQENWLYPRLPALFNHAALLVYLGICAYTFYYFYFNFQAVAIFRMGSYTQHDFIVGLLMVLLVMELSRLMHPVLFWVNVVMIVYTIWGYLSPVDFFWHPGTTFYRLITSSSVEFATGVFGLYAQLALTLIAAFLMLAAVAAGFDAQNALVNVMRRLAGRSRHTIPQTAVLSSVSVGMVSGSGAANTAVTGSFTIPLMKRYGIPPVFAGAVETSASMGGLIMPPLMGVAGFLMAEFLSVPYWDVVVRGFAVAFVYFCSLTLAVYLLSVRLLPNDPIATPSVPGYQQVKTAVFFGGIAFLVLLMGYWGFGAMRAALWTSGFMFIGLLAAFLFFKHVLDDDQVRDETLFGNLRKIVETHAEMTSYIVLLMATLGIMIGLFTVTGFILRMGAMLVQLGDWHIMATILLAFAFGWLAGTGLPPTATYIIVAIIIVPPLRELGVDPWVAHFFAFLLAIWGELSPPTSLTAAVASRIAGASFMRTMMVALKICFPITIMSFAIFTRPEMVTTPGWGQIYHTLLVAVGTTSVTFATFGTYTRSWMSNMAAKLSLALAAAVVLFHPNETLAVIVALAALAATLYGVSRHRQYGQTHPPSPSAQAAEL
ncbi:TRAP transporter permease [Alkalilacustris brevis]|uniref:TRAP transporter permease n=1 Tax=Alkalilacustris brevis TaxID=2026338 RepID=UPI00192E343B|nr:TRAP transporter fused permease subunit [Alkalilacustris brevis]